MFRKNRKTCKQCEYITRKQYQIKYQEDNKEYIRDHKRIYMKSKNNFYVPVTRKKKTRKPHIRNSINMYPIKVTPLNIKDIELFIKMDFLL